MKKVKLWSVKNTDGKMKAEYVPDVDNTDTEQILEDLLVESPELLMDELSLIGRQIPTEGGPLDLLGVDEDGGLVVFELKRGTLTRDAVAQILDYASDLVAMEQDRFAKLVEESSGKYGIDPIEDFADWYSQNFPNRDSVFETPPRMVLVGLGVDRRALRIVNFLANTGLNIALLTFNAFKRDGTLFFARLVESAAPASTQPQPSQNKENNLQVLRANAEKLDVASLLEEIADHVEKKIPAYRWPGKTTYAFSLNEHTEQGRPTLRVYLNVSLAYGKKGVVNLVFQERAVKALGNRIEPIRQQFPKASKKNKYGQIEIQVNEENWPQIRQSLDPVLADMVDAWKKKTSEEQQNDRPAGGSGGASGEANDDRLGV